MSSQLINSKLDALARQPFRAKFHLGEKEKGILSQKGLPIIRQHAYELLAKRLGPEDPQNDGKQTPFKGHPAFVAQHATATCCRGCLAKWHAIPKGAQLSEDELRYMVEVISAWVERDVALRR